MRVVTSPLVGTGTDPPPPGVLELPTYHSMLYMGSEFVSEVVTCEVSV